MSQHEFDNDNENNNNNTHLNKKRHRIKPPCQLCKTNESKYICPRCQTKTCSVQCVKNHKQKFGCSGQRDKYRIVNDQKDYNEKTFYRDINYLSNTINDINTTNKKVFCLMENNTITAEDNSNDTKKQQSKQHKNFKRICKKFRLVTLHKCPEHLQRAKENQSYLDSNTKKIYWTIKFTFLNRKNNINCEHLFTKKTFDDEITCLNDIITYMNEHKDDIGNAELLIITSQVDWLKNYDIYYKIMISDNMDVIDKAKYFCYDKLYYEQCDSSLSLKECLKNKDVFEYPEFFFISKQ